MIHRGADWALIGADCRIALAKFAANRFDSVVTDPPYELGFMGKRWDASGIAFSVDLWREVLRVLKPGAFMLAFGGTRTAHRMFCAIEDAGFDVRDSLHWFYGTGFPKSLNLGEGRGTALKPAHEPICLAMKPLEGTFAKNLAAHGTGFLNIDACRIGTDVVGGGGGGGAFGNGWADGSGLVKKYEARPVIGRWPANVLLDEGAAAELDASTSGLKSSGQIGAQTGAAISARVGNTVYGEHNAPRGEWNAYGDSGGASRFFYVAKPGRAERDQGCEHLAPKTGGEATDRQDGSIGVDNPRAGAGRTGGARNWHPTVKPVTLMRYLVRLITPRGGTVLDPFTGSGTTGMAARLELRKFVGIEREAEFIEIARRRIVAARSEP